MKYLLLALLSFNAQAACLEFNFQKIYNDVETDCEAVALMAMKDHGCEEAEAKKALSGARDPGTLEIQNGSAGFCKYTMTSGILQVMTDEMDPNPRAVVFFSRWD